MFWRSILPHTLPLHSSILRQQSKIARQLRGRGDPPQNCLYRSTDFVRAVNARGPPGTLLNINLDFVQVRRHGASASLPSGADNIQIKHILWYDIKILGTYATAPRSSRSHTSHAVVCRRGRHAVMLLLFCGFLRSIGTKQ